MDNKSKENNDDSFFEDEPLNKNKIWLAIIIIAIITAVAVWFWFAKGEDLWLSSSQDKLQEDKSKTFSKGYEAVKERILQEVEMLEHEGSVAKNTVSTQNNTVSSEVVSDIKKQKEEAIKDTSESSSISNEWKAPASNYGRTSDDVVRSDFIDNLAAWLVKNYYPSKTKVRPGTIALSIQDVNLRYGGQLIGFTWSGNNHQKGRADVLKYVFTPSMLEALYRLYVDRFMNVISDGLSTPKNNKYLNLQQKQEFYRLYAKEFRGISGALQGIAAMPDFIKKMKQVNIASQKVIDASSSYTDTIEQIEALSAKSSQEQLTLKVELAAKAYQQAIINRERVLSGIANTIKQNAAARILDDSSLLYIAFWVERRIKGNTEKMDAVLQAATIFLDLAKRFEVSSGVISNN